MPDPPQVAGRRGGRCRCHPLTPRERRLAWVWVGGPTVLIAASIVLMVTGNTYLGFLGLVLWIIILVPGLAVVAYLYDLSPRHRDLSTHVDGCPVLARAAGVDPNMTLRLRSRWIQTGVAATGAGLSLPALLLLTHAVLTPGISPILYLGGSLLLAPLWLTVRAPFLGATLDPTGAHANNLFASRRAAWDDVRSVDVQFVPWVRGGGWFALLLIIDDGGLSLDYVSRYDVEVVRAYRAAHVADPEGSRRDAR